MSRKNFILERKKIIGSRIRELREAKGLTQPELAELLGTYPGYISEMENGKKMPGTEILASLKQELLANINWLITGIGERFQDIADTDMAVNETQPAYAKSPSKIDLMIADSLAHHKIETFSVGEIERIRNMVDMLLEILVSKSDDTKNAIESNLFTFQHTVRSEKDNQQKDMKISLLEKKNAELTERLERLEERLGTQNANDFKIQGQQGGKHSKGGRR